jgi:hypothetical protein
MADDREEVEPYEPPRIAERADIALPLIGETSGFCVSFTTH